MNDLHQEFQWFTGFVNQICIDLQATDFQRKQYLDAIGQRLTQTTHGQQPNYPTSPYNAAHIDSIVP